MINSQLIKDHYNHLLVKKTIQRFSQSHKAVRAGNFDFKGWYINRSDNSKKMFKPTNEGSYKRLIHNVDRSIYLTLNYFPDSYKPFIDFQNSSFEIAGFEETKLFMLSIDVDLKDEHDITENDSLRALEIAVAFIKPRIDELSNGKFISFFSGNGIYFHLHPEFAHIKSIIRGMERVNGYIILTGAFNAFIKDLENKFYEEYPNLIDFVKFDSVNNRNRLIKAPFSVHKRFDHVVYPLDEEYKIMIKELPLNDNDLKNAADFINSFLEEEPSESDRFHFKEAMEKFIQPLQQEANDFKNLDIKVPENAIPENIILKEPFCRAVFSHESWGDGNIRRVSFIASILHHCGWRTLDIHKYIYNLVNDWNTEIPDLERRIKFKTGELSSAETEGYYPPGYDKLYGGHESFPKIRFGDQINHLPDKSELKCKHPLQLIFHEYKKFKRTIHDFDDGYSLEIDAFENKFNTTVIYQFINSDGKESKRVVEAKNPLEITIRSNLGIEIGKHLPSPPDISIKDRDNKFEDILRAISTIVEEIIVDKKESQDILATKKNKDIKDAINEGRISLETTDTPLLWIGNEIDWFTAGERLNILLAFIAYCSQVILKNPISVIAIGEGGSGKTHIIETALSMIPKEYVITVKSTTDAALFGFCEDDPKYFDGKIVNIGDMGGKNDHEEAQNFKNAMKELQSDGHMARIKQVPKSDGGFENYTYELEGHPCLTYTNVPGYDFDDQEKSRSIFINPRYDNNKAYMVFKRLYSQKNTPSSKLIESHRVNIPIVQKMVLALRERMDDVEIYNPYWGFMEKFLSDTRFLKRDVDKYDGILRVITCINGYNRKLHEINSNKTLFTTKEDILLFMDLLERYYESITINLSPGASDLLDDLRQHFEDWHIDDDGITVNDYIDKSGTKVSKRSLRQYFSELNSQNLVQVVDNVRRANIYKLVTNSENLMDTDIVLTDLDVKVLEFNYELVTLESYEFGVPTPSLGSCLDGSKQPLWNRYLPNQDDSNGYASSSRYNNENNSKDYDVIKFKKNRNKEDLNGDAVSESNNLKISEEFNAFR